MFTKRNQSVMAGVFLIIMLLVAPIWAAPENIGYFYDKMLRLTKVQYEDGTTIEYAYDLLGNRQARTILVSGSPNDPPQTPSNPVPVNGATAVSPHHPALQWSGSDPDPGDTLFYDIYFGTDLDPPLFTSTSQPAVSDLGELDSNRTYYWKIVAKDSHNAVTEGPLWSFTTANDPPPIPQDPVPMIGAVIATNNAHLEWACGFDPNPDDNITFDIYFGTAQPLSLVQANQIEQMYMLGNLSSSTHYYWQVVAKDNHGAEAWGPVWEFDTLDHGSTLLYNITYTQNTTLTRAGGPYVVRGPLTINTGVTLTIEPGTILKFELYSKIEVNGTLLAQGTEAQPIIFTSLKDDDYGGDTNNDGATSQPQRGDWGGINFNTGSGSSSVLDHCVLKYGGANGNAFIFINQASPTIRNSLLSESSTAGIRYSGQATISGNKITNNAYYGIMATSGPSEIRDNEFSGNRNYDIYVSATNNNIKITGNTIRNGIEGWNGIQEITGNTTIASILSESAVTMCTRF
jgi:parallel beta-helix repeat protein/YD repeat-containing protein